MQKLDVEQLRLLVSAPGALNPLWLSLSCEELRVFGVFEKVTEHIKKLPGTCVLLRKRSGIDVALEYFFLESEKSSGKGLHAQQHNSYIEQEQVFMKIIVISLLVISP